MSSRSGAAQHVIDIGSPAWCRARLGTAGEGVLRHPDDRRGASPVVTYTVSGPVISILLDPSTSSGWSAAGREVCLEVGAVTLDGLRWVVRASGQAERPDCTGSPSLAHSRLLHPAAQADPGSSVTPDWLILLAPRVRGFYETSPTAL